jgi:hypothetical protein
MIMGLPERGAPLRALVSACHAAPGPFGPDTRDDETGGPIVTGRLLIMGQGGAPARLGDIDSSIGNKAMAKAM